MTDRFQPRTDETPLWVRGKLALWVEGPDTPGHMITLNRPHAVVGRLSTCDVVVPRGAVGSRHLYLHLDRRGLFAVDLASRTGTRFPPVAETAGDPTGRIAWLKVGDQIEIADHKIEIVKARVKEDAETDDSSLRLPRFDEARRSPNSEAVPRPPMPNPLADSASNPALVSIALVPQDRSSPPSALTSELIFIGRSLACGLRVEDPNLSRVEGVLVRSEAGAFLVVFGGDRVRVDDRVVPRTVPLADGSILSIGNHSYEIRVSRHSDRPRAPVLGASSSAFTHPASSSLATIDPHRFIADTHSFMSHDHGSELLERRSEPVEILSAAMQSGASADQLLAWLMGAVQSSQAELARRQTNFQQTIIELVQKSRVEHYELMRAQLERIEKIDEEIVALREELQKHTLKDQAPRPRYEIPRADANRTAEPVPDSLERTPTPIPNPNAIPNPSAPVAHDSESTTADRPIRSRETRPPVSTPSPAGVESTTSTAWLIERINRLDRENRASRKSLLERLTSLGKPAS